MYSAITIANIFLQLAMESGKKLTNMKLQKLVYIAHGWSLAITGNPLLRDPVYAWQWGPVIRPLYEQLKHYGAGIVSDPIPLESYELEEQVNEQSMRIIRAVWKAYGHYSALDLSAITHQDSTPWSKTWRELGQYNEIPSDLIRDHYVELKNARSRARAGTAA